jgi:hypothetical protein
MKRLCFLIFAIVLLGCQPDPLPIDLPEYEERITVASRVFPNTIMVVGLTNSFTLLSEAGFTGEVDSTFIASLLLDSALVTVEYGNQKDTLFNTAPGIYTSISTPQFENSKYTLSVFDYRTGRSVKATTEMLPRVDFDYVQPTAILNETDTMVSIDFAFTDIPNQNNYYLVNVYKEDLIGQLLDVNDFFDQGSNRLVESKIYADIESENGVISDVIELEGVLQSDSLVITLANISKDYYAYLIQRQRAANNILGQITNEPINYNSNVEGGLGFFNAHNPDIILIDEADYP